MYYSFSKQLNRVNIIKWNSGLYNLKPAVRRIDLCYNAYNCRICINVIKTQLKIDSEVATDVQKDQFLSILKNGDAPDTMKSQYAVNYRFFQAKINEFLNDYPTYFAYLPARLINNCILLPIEAESQDTALRIFSTLNDRGMPLSDSDIFKAQFYKFYSSQGKKDDFIKKWKELEELSNKIFHPISGIPMD